MLRCSALLALACAACSHEDPPPPIDVPMGYTGPVKLTIENHATGGVVTSNPPGIQCPKTCDAEFNVGTTVHLTLDNNSDMYFLAVFSKPCVKSDDFSCDVTLTGPADVGVEGAQEVR
jgi:hypothetical protein